ncbi:hypothetical protein PI124_g22701 [Phytophthora idaei]|nr:hypothetical protein PI124_g22701 [Phytophthora idaei]
MQLSSAEVSTLPEAVQESAVSASAAPVTVIRADAASAESMPTVAVSHEGQTTIRVLSSTKKTKVVQRLKWTNAMVAEMLCLRFEDGDVKRRLESADTKTKKALTWQQFVSALSLLVKRSVETAVADEDTSKKASPSKGKLQPVVELANALQTGMEAIAASVSAVPMGGDHLQQLVAAIQQQARAMTEQREETRQFQTMQLQLLRELLASKSQ